MREEVVVHILSVEQQALKLYEDAQDQAAQIVEQAQKTASQTRKQALEEAQQQAEDIVAHGRKIAEIKRANIIAHAGADAQNLETVSARHFEDAVQIVLNNITAHE